MTGTSKLGTTMKKRMMLAQQAIRNIPLLIVFLGIYLVVFHTRILRTQFTRTSSGSLDKMEQTMIDENNSNNYRNAIYGAAMINSITTANPSTGIVEINFSNNITNVERTGMAACLINLDDTIKLAEWLPYHYTVLPLSAVVIALDPKTSERAIHRTLQLIDLWKDKIDITLWPNFILPERERRRKRVPYVRERQVYFAKRCLIYHKEKQRNWTLLTDNDEYFTFNYIHDDEEISLYNPPGRPWRKIIREERKKNSLIRKNLPNISNTTVLDFLDANQNRERFPRCVRVPYIQYGGGIPFENYTHQDVIPADMLATIGNVHHSRRDGQSSKVIIDLRRVAMDDLEKDRSKTIHNPNRIVCGKNGVYDSGADYIASVFRLNHYLGSIESFFERKGDYRRRDENSYQSKAKTVNVTNGAKFDYDVIPWMDAFIQKVGKGDAIKLLSPLKSYVSEERALRLKVTSSS
jgi:hypothetical protein